MKKSEIKFNIELDNQNVPDKITWEATERHPPVVEPTKAICVSIWDYKQQNTLKIDLWTKDMPIDEMKRFFVETIGGLGETLKNATGDDVMVSEINELCERLGKYLEKQSKV